MIDLFLSAPPTVDRNKHIRLFNSLNPTSYNTHTKELYEASDPGVQVIIATDTLCHGANIIGIQDVIMVGEVADADDFVQWCGRANRDRKLASARGIMYVTQGAEELARAVLHPTQATTRRRGKKKVESSKPTPTMQPSVAAIILAPSGTIADALDILYDNPTNVPRCRCATCTSRPAPSTSPSLHQDNSSDTQNHVCLFIESCLHEANTICTC